jgi:hypothetical protein
MADGVIARYGVGAGIGGGGSDANDRKRAREGYSPGPSTKRRTGSTVKKEEMSATSRAQRIEALQVSGVNFRFCNAVAPDKLSVYIGRTEFLDRRAIWLFFSQA